MLEGLNIHYHNLRGLTSGKFEYYTQLINKNKNLVIIFAETWFPKDNTMWTNTPHYLASPFFMVESLRPHVSRTTGHENGGLCVLAHPSVRPHIVLKKRTVYSLTFSVYDINVSGVYLPPRLTPEEINVELEAIPPSSSIILGDFNVRYGRSLFSDQSTYPQRRTVIDGIMNHRGLEHLVPVNPPCFTDHVFSNRPGSFSYTPISEIPIDSDHGRIEFQLREQLVQTNVEAPKLRYAFRVLNNPVIASATIAEWSDDRTLLISTLIREANVEVRRNPNRDTVHNLIDSVYGVFTEELYDLCDTMFLKYDPQEVQNQPDKTMAIDDTCSHRHIIRAFKRSQRPRAVLQHIQSRDPEKAPMTEAFEHYSAMFSERSDGFDRDIDPVSIDFLNDACPQIGGILKSVIEKYPTAKSGGPDQLHTQLFRVLIESDGFFGNLVDLFQLFLFAGVTPTAWNESSICLILKDPSQPYANKTRPIALTQILRRFFESCFLRTILRDKRRWMETSSIQFGFKTGFGVTSQLINAHETTLKGCKIGTFLDLQGAYDRVVHYRLAEKIKMRGGSARELSLISSLMFEQVTSSLVVNGLQHPDQIHRKHGLFQGSLLSPCLFNVYIDDLAAMLSVDNPTGVATCLLFADDIKIGSKTVQENQRYVNICQEWAVTNGMQFNISKCGTVGTTVPVQLDGVEVPIVDSYKYLGAPHSARGIEFVEHLRSVTRKVINFLRAQRAQCQNWPMWARMHICKVFGLSQMQYLLGLCLIFIRRCSETVQQECLILRKQVRDETLKFIFGIDNVSRTNLLESMAGLWSLEIQEGYLLGNLSAHLLSLDPTNQLHLLKLDAFLALNPRSVVRIAYASPWRAQYEREMSDLPLQDRIRFKKWCQRKQLVDWASKGKLPAYIGNSQRNQQTLSDIVFSRDRNFSSQAYRWRMNTMFIGRRCECGQLFNRGHIEECHLLDDDEVAIQLIRSFYYRSKKEEIQRVLRNNSFHYTALDEALNRSDIEKFSHLLEVLETKLYPPGVD